MMEVSAGESNASQRDEKFWVRMREMRMDHWFPMHSPPWMISGMVLVAAVFIPLGALVLLASEKVTEVKVSYQGVDGNPPCTWDRRVELSGANPQPWEIVDHCATQVTFEVTETINSPVFMYYELSDFNQNFRYLVRSRSDHQYMYGGSCECEDDTACPPYYTYGENWDEEGFTANFTDGTERSLKSWGLLPCGQMAYTMFNDSFVLREVVNGSPDVVCNGSDFDHKGTPLGATPRNYCEKDDIAWSGDRDVRFTSVNRDPGFVSYHGVEDVEAVVDKAGAEVPGGAGYLTNGFYWREWGHKVPRQDDYDFMVWARPASVPTFKKLYRKITKDITPGTYVLDVEERFDTSSFGHKKIILASRTWVGADNTVLGASYCAVGGLAFVLALVITAVNMVNPVGGYTIEAMQRVAGTTQPFSGG